jgi:hypothetical protein
MGVAVLHSCLNNTHTLNGVPGSVSYNFHIRPILSDKCFKCHGPDANKREAGLRLDLQENAFSPLRETRGAFAIVPGNPEASEVYKRISSMDSSYQMPTPESHLGLLSAHEISLIKQWIRQGAKYELHWAFILPVKTPLPEIEKEWCINAIDNFIAKKLQDIGLKHSPEASREQLLKRLSLDLTGLPPTPELADQFLNDKRVDAYERVVDALLANPQYGEKMALHWLDVARFADSFGYQDDNLRTQWAWRDWVIHAFNTNLSYDKFLTWQIAGDMLPNSSREQLLATGFLRNHKITEEGGVIPEEYRMQYHIDKTKTLTKGVLALTAECAQCHDHKYDPISQKEYYQFLAFFNSSKEKGVDGGFSDGNFSKNPIMEITEKEVKTIFSFINKPDTGVVRLSVMGELDTIRKTYVLERGSYEKPSYEVKPAALNSVLIFDSVNLPRNRLGLASWTTSRNNPLTARVFVNQMWQELFGRGIVKSSGDFGMQGDLPTHPELLDWLAVDFMEHGWDIKRLMKQFVLSATYRQSAKYSKAAMETDPENLYLSHAPRIRLKAEFVRDLVLSSSGLLVGRIGGPSVKPYQPKGLWEASTSGRGALTNYVQDKGDNLYRRGMYTFIKLTLPPPGMMMFDASNRDQCEVKRLQTNTPLQALIMMNDPTVLEASRVLAQRLVEKNLDAGTNIRLAFRLIICRNPSVKEEQILNGYFDEQMVQFTSRKLDAAKTLQVGEFPINKKIDLNNSAALMKVIITIYNLEEAITKS